MKTVKVFFITLYNLIRRDGFFVFVKKCLQYTFQPKAFLWLTRGGRHENEDKSSVMEFNVTPIEEDSESFRALSGRLLRGYNPKVSVVVTSYNYAHLIRETLDSLVAQTYKNFEVLIVDNGSQDNSVEIIKEYEEKYPNFFLLQHEGCVNKGLPASVKLGAERATGEFVAFCEADDIWLPEHLQKKVELLREYWGEPNFIINDIDFFGDPQRCAEYEPLIEIRRFALKRVRNRISPLEFRDKNWVFTFSICMVRRSILLSCDMLSAPRASSLDWWLWRQVCFDNDIYCVHEKLTRWRLHKTSFTVKDDHAQSTAYGIDLITKMDALLYRKHPITGDMLSQFVGPEARVTFREDKLFISGIEVQSPSFSIVIPVLEDSLKLQNTLKSIEQQLNQNYEVIFVSIAGNNDIGNVCQQWKSRLAKNVTVKLVLSDSNTFESLFLAGIREASNDWLLLIMAGDLLRPISLHYFASRILFVDNNVDVIGSLALLLKLGSAIGKMNLPIKGMSISYSSIGACVIRRGSDFVNKFLSDKSSYNDEIPYVCFFDSSNSAYIFQALLFLDDSLDGRNPEGDSTQAVISNFMKSLTS